MSRWTDEEIKYLIENYQNFSQKELGEKLGRTKNAVQVKIGKLGLSMNTSKYTYDKNFFEVINTEEKAYWLGFIYADGYVVYNPNTRNYELGIELQLGDKNHLKKFNKSLKGNVEVSERTKKCNLNGKMYTQCLIRFYNKKMVEDLIKLGVVPNKSKTLQTIPSIDEKLVRHFIRGYFDGDGCITFDNQHNHPKADFTSGSIEFLNDIRAWMYKCGVGSYTYQEREDTYRLFIRGLNNFDKFFNLLYSDSTIYLDRKFKRKISIYEEHNVAQRLPR